MCGKNLSLKRFGNEKLKILMKNVENHFLNLLTFLKNINLTENFEKGLKFESIRIKIS